MSTKIQWCDESWNPIVGCRKASAGCENCYAETAAASPRLQKFDKYQTVICDHQWNGEVFFDEKALMKPLSWKKPRRIFVCSMGDLFYGGVHSSWLDRVMDVIWQCPQHTFIVLTKRPERMFGYWWQMSIVPKNILWGTTIENYKSFLDRYSELTRYKGLEKIISCEPLLSKIDLYLDFVKPAWVIVGCESGPNRRECKLEWVRDIVGQCKSANVPVFVKQLDIGGKVVKELEDFPEDLRIREFPDVLNLIEEKG